MSTLRIEATTLDTTYDELATELQSGGIVSLTSAVFPGKSEYYRSLTREEVLSLPPKTDVPFLSAEGYLGFVKIGKIKTWKRNPERIEISSRIYERGYHILTFDATTIYRLLKQERPAITWEDLHAGEESSNGE